MPDTCVLQNVDNLFRTFKPTGPVEWDEATTSTLLKRFGAELVDDLIALDVMYQRHEYKSGCPWLICCAAVEEAGLLRGPKGDSLNGLIQFLSGHQDLWSNDAYPGIAPGLLLAKGAVRVSPLILRALGETAANEVHAPEGPLRFLPD